MAEVSMDGLEGLVQEVFTEKQGLKQFLEVLLERVMAAEVSDHVGAERHQRSEDRRGQRNGYKPRSLNTRVGKLQLSVPQTRGCEPYHPSLWARWQRSERALLVACAEMYFQGVSTRKVQQVLEEMCQGEISAMTVSRVAAELDEKLEAFRSRRLDGWAWPYLMIDARYEKVRVEGKVVSQAVLVVIGFNSQGHREILDWRLGDSESESTWGQIFSSLKDRGLAGVKLLVSDAHGGIRAAMRRHLQNVAWQRCRVHFKRELGRKVSYKLLKELMRDLVAVFAPEERTECLRRGEEMACKWEAGHPQVARMLREGLEDCLTVLSMPATHRKRLASTNLAENLMKQLKQRTAVVGVFPNRSSCERLIGAVLVETHESWQVPEGRWFNMELAE
jgi:transposase-like protein